MRNGITNNVIKKSITLLRKCLIDNYRICWETDVKNLIVNPKMRTYCKFKTVFSYEPYLTSVIDFKLRKNLTRLRTSNHQLEIEKGRHSNIPANLRLCKVCNSGDVEDEYHVLMCCNKYIDLRLFLAI